MTSSDKLVLIAGNANLPLAKDIAKHLEHPLAKAKVGTFSDGETEVQILEDVRGGDVFVIQPTHAPSNQNLMELLIILDALKRASAARITAVMPYLSYSRQDRKDKPRVPITAKLTANLIATAGADRVLTLDLHAHQIQGFFDIPLDHLYAAPVFLQHIAGHGIKNPVIVSPDIGGMKMARGFAARLNTDMAVIDKRRVNDHTIEVMNILGDIKGRDVILVDDMVATAGSLTEAAAVLKKAGAKRVYAVATHPILSGPAIQRLNDSALEKLWVSDSIKLKKSQEHPKIEIVSIAGLFAEAIGRIHRAESVSSLF